MNCREARNLLLEADRPALLGETTTELGRHVTTCPECGALARQIFDAEAALDRALARLPERPRKAARPARPRPRRWMRLATTWGAAAAAATLVLFVVPRRRQPEGRVRTPVNQSDPAAVDVDVSGGPGRMAVVFRTADPKITVVWFFQD